MYFQLMQMIITTDSVARKIFAPKLTAEHFVQLAKEIIATNIKSKC